MKNRILTFAMCLAIGLGSFSCHKQEDPTPTNPNKIPVRVAKTFKRTSLTNTADGFTSYVISTSDGYSYTITVQETNGYTSFVVTEAGGTTGACLDKIIAVLEKWANFNGSGDPCTVLHTLFDDLRSLRVCVPASERANFDEALDQIDDEVDDFCQ